MNENYPEINAKAQVGASGSVLEFYREMIDLRQNSGHRDCLIYGQIEPLECSGQVIAYARKNEDETIYCYFNFSNETAEEPLPKSGLEIFWGNQETAGKPGNILKLKPYQAVLMK